MKFLQAKKILRQSSTNQSVTCEVLASSQVENVSPFLEAHLALKGVAATVVFTPFGTLRQRLLAGGDADSNMPIACFFPWDYCPQLDWRNDQVAASVSLDELMQQVVAFDELLGNTVQTGVFIAAPIPPLLSPKETNKLVNVIASYAVKRGFTLVGEQSFSLATYLEFGRPIANAVVPDVAGLMADQLFTSIEAPVAKKVILTDLDNTAWLGIVGEDGVQGVACAPFGPGFAQYIYQCFLKRCVDSGVLLVAVSKNDADLAKAPFEQETFPLTLADFVIFKTGYGHKSTLIQQVSEELNLPLDSFVFVDDNPVELAEVAAVLPSVMGIQFPAQADALPDVLEKLQKHFIFSNGSKEDSARTALYKMRSLAEKEREKAPSLQQYLTSLEMELHINTGASVDKARALQLINKTNQFNLNGLKLTDEQLSKILTVGGQLFTATLIDKFGNHGDVVACVVDSEGQLLRWVMSCRVLQRNVEYYFLYWLLVESSISLRGIDFIKTDRNTPIEQFLNTVGILSAINGQKVNSIDEVEGIRSDLHKVFDGIFNVVRVN